MLTHESSPIVAIRNKEIDLSAQLAAARRAAEAELQSTRSLVVELSTDAKVETCAESEYDYQAGVAQADDEAAQIVAGGAQVAEQIASVGRQQVASLADQILDFILPPVRVRASMPVRAADGLPDCLAIGPLSLQRMDESATVKSR